MSRKSFFFFLTNQVSLGVSEESPDRRLVIHYAMKVTKARSDYLALDLVLVFLRCGISL